jgi:hypothetical protein
LDLKANIASPTFTGTVSGIDKTMVGLGNVDNTSDLNKPISTATQTALNLKANDSQVVHLTGSETISGIKTFSTGNIFAGLIATTSSSNGTAIEVNNNASGSSIGVDINNTGNGIGLNISGSSTGNNFVSNFGIGGSGYNYVGQNNGTNTFTVDKTGDIIANSFTKTGGTSSQFLKADGSVDGTAYLASASYTAADVLSKLLTVDGSGSGLDADLLRGVHWGNINTNVVTSGAFTSTSTGNNSFTGNLAIGKATPATTLEIFNTSNPSFRISKTGDLVSGLEIGRDGATLASFIIQRENADLFFRTNNADRLRIKAGGNVSIGNNNDTYKLDVSGTGRFTGDLTANSFIKSGGTDQQALLADGSTKVVPLVYTALVSQSGTSAPTATVLENTLDGTVVWSRDSTGSYRATLAGVFTGNTVIFCTVTPGRIGKFITAIRNVPDYCIFQTAGNSGTVEDTVFANTSVKIEVYP